MNDNANDIRAAIEVFAETRKQHEFLGERAAYEIGLDAASKLYGIDLLAFWGIDEEWLDITLVKFPIFTLMNIFKFHSENTKPFTLDDLNVYDQLKELGSEVQISQLRLLEKSRLVQRLDDDTYISCSKIKQ